jgi:hypothetical protein
MSATAECLHRRNEHTVQIRVGVSSPERASYQLPTGLCAWLSIHPLCESKLSKKKRKQGPLGRTQDISVQRDREALGWGRAGGSWAAGARELGGDTCLACHR